MNSWVWDKIGLKFVQIDIQSTIESEGRSDTGDNLGDESIEMFVVWAWDIEVATANIIDGCS